MLVIVNEALLIVRRYIIVLLGCRCYNLICFCNWNCLGEVIERIVWIRVVLGLWEYWSELFIGIYKVKLLWDVYYEVDIECREYEDDIGSRSLGKYY